LGAFVTVAVDGGATLLVTYQLGQTISAAIPGLTAALSGTTAAIAAWVGFLAGSIKWNTLPYLSRFFAFACDAFGVPRHVDQSPINVKFGNGKSHVLPEPHVPQQPIVYRLEDVRLWQQAEGFAKFKSVLSND
jgi:hypothetical protein